LLFGANEHIDAPIKGSVAVASNGRCRLEIRLVQKNGDPKVAIFNTAFDGQA
jgi:hypothetical protein